MKKKARMVCVDNSTRSSVLFLTEGKAYDVEINLIGEVVTKNDYGVPSVYERSRFVPDDGSVAAIDEVEL